MNLLGSTAGSTAGSTVVSAQLPTGLPVHHLQEVVSFWLATSAMKKMCFLISCHKLGVAMLMLSIHLKDKQEC